MARPDYHPEKMMNRPIITPFELGRLRFDLDQIYRLPRDHPYQGQTVDIPVQCYHIALGERSILVDASFYDPDLVGDMLVPDYTAPPGLVEQLAGRQISPESITDVVITHRHFDHYSGISRKEDGRYTPLFPKARHYLGAGDWQPNDFGKLDERTLVVVNNAGLLELVGGEMEIGEGLTIRPMPGETPGHQILAVAHEGRRSYFTGDLFHHEIEFDHEALNVFWAHRTIMNQSKQAFKEEAAVSEDGAANLVYSAHIYGPYALLRSGQGFEWRQATG